jgi:hypothetical protein
MSNMTSEEFYEKYKDVSFKLHSYYKYTFTFTGDYNGEVVTVEVGGNSDDIYREEFSIDCKETIQSLQPFSGECGEDSFYDY